MAKVVTMRTSAGRELGTDQARPALGWTTEGADELLCYRVQLAHDPLFDRLRADTGEQAGAPAWVPWPGPDLASRERVHWRVQVLTETGWTGWSAAEVEAGLLSPVDWLALPLGIANDQGAQVPSPSPRLSTAFALPAAPVRARLYVTALGVLEATVNGQPVSDDVLSPGWSSYDKRLAYDTYDVTALLNEGDNELAALLGDGWYRGSLVWGDRRHRSHYGERTALLAQLEATLVDGSTVVVATGPDGWRATTSAVRSSDLYDGCDIDQTAPPEPLLPEVLEVDLLARLFVRQGPPIRRTAVFAGAKKGDVYDFGQNLAGWVRLKVRAQRGQVVTLRHAEVLQDGQLLTTPLRTAKATDTWVLEAGEHVLEPTFTFHGFRYCDVVTDAEVLSVEAVAVHSDLRPTAEFTCSDPRLEQLHSNVVWGQRGNFLSVPTDCPQRDERLGWTGDAQVFAATASLLHDCRGFFADWLADLRVEQHADGQVPVVVPDVLTPEEAGIAGWGDASVVVPWQVAMRSGDLDVLRHSLPSMRAWVDWVVSDSTDGLWLTDKQLGDWLDPDAPDDQPWAAKADRKLVANAVLVQSARLLAESLELCGEDGSRYAQLADATARRTWERWGVEAVTSQTGCALALRSGLVPEEERHAVGQVLADLVVANEGRIGTGFLGTPEVLYALSDTGQLDAAYQLLMCDECPSWLYQVARGATTMWERWDAIRADGSVNLGLKAEDDPGMLSFNHYAYGAVAGWMHEVLAGLTVRELPIPTLLVAPKPGGGLTRASSRQETPHGPAEVIWHLEGANVVVNATVPPGYVARLQVPLGFAGDSTDLPPGRSCWSFSPF
jgi:alpha-L-rhamnosidase